jgi:DNA-binding PadR family transcriptional regulator
MNERDESIRSKLPLRPLEFLVLAVLEDGPLHGYGMVQRIERRTDGVVRVRPGDLYRVLYRMRKRSLLETTAARSSGSSVSDDASAREEARRTYYRLTSLGRRVLQAEANLLRSVVAGVGGLGRKKKASPA